MIKTLCARRWAPGWIILAAIVSAPLTLGAQQHQRDASMERMVEALDFDRGLNDRARLGPSEVQPANLGVQWQLITRVLSQGEEAAHEIQALRALQVSLGVVNAPDSMFAAIAIIERAHAEGRLSTQAALQSLSAAATLAPELPHAHFARARLIARHAPSRLGQGTRSLWLGYKKGLTYEESRRPLWFDVTLYALLGALGAALMLLCTQTVRYFSVLSYDAARVLPRGVSSVQATLALLALVLTPGLLVQSPLLSLAVLLALLAIVQQPRERLASIACFALLASLPSIDHQLATALSWNTSPSRELFLAQHRRCDERCARRVALAHRELKGSQDRSDPMLDHTAWLLSYRRGELDALLGPAGITSEQVSAWPEPMRGHGLALLGAALLAADRPEEALEPLQLAEVELDDSAAPSLNLMRAYQVLNDRELARDALSRASSRQLEVVVQRLDLERRDVNSAVLVEPLPGAMFWAHHLKRAAPRQAAVLEPLWPSLAGPHLPFESSLWIGLGGALLGLLTLPLTLTSRCSTPCPSCGLARDPRDGATSSNHPYCLNCYEAFVMGATMSYDERVASDAMLHGRRRRQALARRYSSLLVPGAGHALAGYGLIGMAMATAACTSAAILFKPRGFWRSPVALLRSDWFGLKVLALLVLLALLAAALWVMRAGLLPLPARTRSCSPPPPADS